MFRRFIKSRGRRRVSRTARTAWNQRSRFPSIAACFEPLEDRRLLAVISASSYSADNDEVNDVKVTADGDWLTYSEGNPNRITYIPGAFNPDFLNDISVTITGDENAHHPIYMLTGACSGTFPAGVAGSCAITGVGTPIPNPVDVPPNTDGDDATFQVDIELNLLDALRALPDANAIVPISASSVALLAVDLPAQIAAAYLLKLPDGAPVDVLNPAIITGILGTLGILGAAQASGDISVDVGNHDDTVDLSAFDKNSDVDLGPGNDTMILGIGDDEVDGGSGADTFMHNLDAGGATKTLNGGAGPDLLDIQTLGQSEVVSLSFAGDTLTLIINGDTTTYSLSGVEEIALSTGGGDDNVTITNVEQFSGGLAIDLGDGFDRVEYVSNVTDVLLSDSPFAVGGGAPWPDGGFGLLTFNGSKISEFVAIEELNLGGSATTVDYRAPDGGNEVHVVGTGATTELRIDANSTIVLKNNPTRLNLDGRSGDDLFFIDPAAGTSLTEINISGGDLAGADVVLLDGTDSADAVEYRPGMDARSGELIFNSIDIDFSSIDELVFDGAGGSDMLVAKGTAGADFINFLPGITENGGTLELTTPSLQYSPIRFVNFESRVIDGLGGGDTLSVGADDLPGVNSSVTVVGGSTSSTFTFNSLGATPTTFEHGPNQMDTLSIELPTTHDSVDVTPGEGITIAVNMGLGENTLNYHAATGEDVDFDLDAGIISQGPTYGDVIFTGTHVVLEGAMQQLTARHSGNDASVLSLRPTGEMSGQFSTRDAFGPTVAFLNVASLNLEGDGSLEYLGSDFSDAINVVQTMDNEVDVNQNVRKPTGAVDYVSVSAKGYSQTVVFGGRDADFFRVEVAQTLAGSMTNEHAVAVIGGLGKDQLVVIDDADGDVILRREEVDEQSGFVQVGHLPPVVYEQTEAVKVFPFDPVTAGTGDDEMGREVVLEADPLEPNDNRLAAHEVNSLEGVNRNPNIGTPGVDLFGTQVLADEDWFRFEATTTGTYRFALIFELVGDPMNSHLLPNGQPGLPDSGELDLVVYDARGNEIVNADDLPTGALTGTALENVVGDLDVIGSPLGNTVNADGGDIAGQQRGLTGKILDVGIEQGTTVYARVKGHTQQAVNAYDLIVLSPQQIADGAIPDLLRDGIIDPADPDFDDIFDNVADPPGGGLRITEVEINSFNPADKVDPDPADPDVEARSPLDIFPPDPRVDPTFQVESITIHLADFPARAPGFQYEAIHETIALQPGNYLLEGDHSGPITIDAIEVENDPVTLGEVATGRVTLRFNAPLPDDRFTLTIRDTLVDPAIRPLDGETNSLSPVETSEFKSGNGVPGGDFVGNFSVDTRVEIGTFFAGSFWLDLNQNGIFDPANPDPLNRDVVYQFGENEGLVDRPVIGDWNGDGFDEVGLYALNVNNGTYQFHLDRNGNGLFDPGPDDEDDPLAFPLLPTPIFDGFPVAADWDADGVDQVGLLATGQWYLDKNGDGQINFDANLPLDRREAVPTNFVGVPFVGNWDGSDESDDGDETTGFRVGSYNLNTGEFFFDMDGDMIYDPEDVDPLNPDKPVDFKVEFDVPGLHRPLVGDFDADFDTNIGLLIANQLQAEPNLHAQWLLDLGDPVKNPLMDDYENDLGMGDDNFEALGDPGDGNFQPAPTGHRGRPLVYQDIFYQVLDPRFAPLAGNFDLPSTRVTPPAGLVAPPPPGPANPLHNDLLPADVNASGTVTFGDLIDMEMFLGAGGPQPMFPDVDNDTLITAQDYLAIWQHLSQFGEGEAPAEVPDVAHRGWLHNRFQPVDVDLNGIATPGDALIVANHVREHGAMPIDDVTFAGKFLDANRDDYVTPLDFLVVVNHLLRDLEARSADASEGETPFAGPALAGPALAGIPTAGGTGVRTTLPGESTPPVEPRAESLDAVGVPPIAAPATRGLDVDAVEDRDEAFESLLTSIATDVDHHWYLERP